MMYSILINILRCVTNMVEKCQWEERNRNKMSYKMVGGFYILGRDKKYWVKLYKNLNFLLTVAT